jgi:hypothetical protein
MTMEDWAKRIDIYLQADDLEVLKDAGKFKLTINIFNVEERKDRICLRKQSLY